MFLIRGFLLERADYFVAILVEHALDILLKGAAFATRQMQQMALGPHNRMGIGHAQHPIQH